MHVLFICCFWGKSDQSCQIWSPYNNTCALQIWSCVAVSFIGLGQYDINNNNEPLISSPMLATYSMFLQTTDILKLEVTGLTATPSASQCKSRVKMIWHVLYKLFYVALPCFYSTPEWTNQTLALGRNVFEGETRGLLLLDATESYTPSL